MARNFFSVPASTIVCTSITLKTVVGVQASTNVCLNSNEYTVSFDGATSSNAPAVVLIGTCTYAGAGSGSSSVTPAKADTGRAETIQATATKNYANAGDPSAITTFKVIDIGQFNGAYSWIVPFSTPLVLIGGKGATIQVTSPNTVNCSADIACEEG